MSSPASATVPVPAAIQNTAKPSGKIYQQRQKDGSVLFTDRPAEQGGVTERSWTVPTEDAEQAEKRREKARQEAKQETQALNDRVQRQLERQQDREEALAIERMRLNQAQAQRDAEIARADRERSDRERVVGPVIVVVPGQRPHDSRPPIGGLPPPHDARRAMPVPARPSASLCTAKKAADCNPGSEQGRSGFGGR